MSDAAKKHSKLTPVEKVVFVVSSVAILAGLSLIVTFIVFGFTVHEWFFRLVGIGSALTAVGAIMNNVNFFLLNVRINKAHKHLHPKIK